MKDFRNLLSNGRLLTASVVFIFLAFILKPSPIPTTIETPAIELYKVERVIDGDTIELENGQKVRYIGIDTPEVEQNECFSSEATIENKKLVEGKMIRLEKDTTDKDKYGRLLRYVWVDDLLINEHLVKGGFAKTLPLPLDTKYKDQFKKSQEEAKENNKGLWSKC